MLNETLSAKVKKCKLLLTFDHELPLGSLHTSFETALFEPTNKVLSTAEDMNVPVTLFTDVLCAIKFKEWSRQDFFEPYQNQLHEVLKRGHDVQLHIHPHWLTTHYNGQNYLPSRDFTLAGFASHPRHNIDSIIKSGVTFLNDSCKKVDKTYQCIAYRGGGYNLFPHKDDIINSLLKYGILFDSSVCKGYYFKSSLSEVDYRKTPSQPNWYLETEIYAGNTDNPGIMEIPIAGIPKKLFEIPTKFKMKKYAGRAPDNFGSQIHENPYSGLKNKLRLMLSSRMLNFDNYTYSSDYLIKILEHNINKYRAYDEIMLCAIGHPKSMSNYSFQLFREFIEKVREKFHDKVEFNTYRKLYGEMKNK